MVEDLTMKMNERIIFARESCGMNQEEFARRLGLTKSAISGYETGRRVPPEHVLKSIAREFQYDEEWLRHGIGDPVARQPEDALEMVFSDFGCSKFEQAFLRSFFFMPEKDRRAFSAYLEQLFQGVASEMNEAGEKEEPWTAERYHEMLDEHLSIEKEPEAGSGASSSGESGTMTGAG